MAIGPNGKQLRGLACLSPEKRKEIASKGQKAARERGLLYKFDHDAAVAAGRKAGSLPRLRASRDRDQRVVPDDLVNVTERTEAVAVFAALDTEDMMATLRKAARGEPEAAPEAAVAVEAPAVLTVPDPLPRFCSFCGASLAVDSPQGCTATRCGKIAEPVRPEPPLIPEPAAAAPLPAPAFISAPESATPETVLSLPVQTMIERYTAAELEARRQASVQRALRQRLEELRAETAARREAEAPGGSDHGV